MPHSPHSGIEYGLFRCAFVEPVVRGPFGLAADVVEVVADDVHVAVAWVVGLCPVPR